jgi:hypothetical protein
LVALLFAQQSMGTLATSRAPAVARTWIATLITLAPWLYFLKHRCNFDRPYRGQQAPKRSPTRSPASSALVSSTSLFDAIFEFLDASADAR